MIDRDDFDPYHRKQPTPPAWLQIAFFLCFLSVVIGVIGMATGCTITPSAVTSSAPGFDGNDRDSGFKGWAPDGSGIISPNAHQRYVALIKTYGGAFKPALKPESGLREQPDGTWLIDKEHLVDFGLMSSLNRSGATPQPP